MIKKRRDFKEWRSGENACFLGIYNTCREEKNAFANSEKLFLFGFRVALLFFCPYAGLLLNRRAFFNRIN